MKDTNFISSLSSPHSEAFVVVDTNVAALCNSTPSETNCIPFDKNTWDILNTSFVDGLRLVVASALVYQIRQEIYQTTGFFCSAGIAANKTLAKLACSLNKPNKQTLVPTESASILLDNTPISKIRYLGGKLGIAVIEKFKVETLGKLNAVPLSSLIKEFGVKTGTWLHNLCQGIDTESITPRSIVQSVGCSKMFLGGSMLTSSNKIEYWLKCLAEELVERLVDDFSENQRYPNRLALYFQTSSLSGSGLTRTLSNQLLHSMIAKLCAVDRANWEKLAFVESCKNCTVKISQAALVLLKEILMINETTETWNPAITSLGLCAGKFVPNNTISHGENIKSMFEKQTVQKLAGNIDHDSLSDPKCPNSSKTKSNLVDQNASTSRSFFKRLRVAELTNLEPPIMESACQKSELSNVKHWQPEIEHDSDSHNSQNFFTSCSNGDWTVCEQCGSRILLCKLIEHQDFHVAQRFQQEWTLEQDGLLGNNGTQNLNKINNININNNVEHVGQSSSISTNNNTIAKKVRNNSSRANRGKHNKIKLTNTLDKFIYRIEK